MKPRRPTVHIADKPTVYVDTLQKLEELAAQLRAVSRVAFDTEFLREVQYWPQLELVQLATDELLAVVDYRAVPTLEPLVEILTDESILKVAHAARQDLEIIYHLTRRVPRPLFDTQVAAALVGLGGQVGYANLVERVLGVSLKKSQTLTNWAQRPLTDAQFAYALDDVRYLLPLHDELAPQLAALKREAWFAREMEHLAEPRRYALVDPQEAWRNVKGASTLAPSDLAVLQAVAAWRERVARAHNRALPLILRDEALLAIARRKPRSKSALRRIRGVHQWTLAHLADELLEVVQKAASLPREQWPRYERGRRPLTEDEQALVRLMAAWVRVRAQEKQVDPSLLATEDDLARLLLAYEEGKHERQPLLQDWRRDVVGAELLALLEGRAALRWDQHQGRFVLVEVG